MQFSFFINISFDHVNPKQLQIIMIIQRCEKEHCNLFDVVSCWAILKYYQLKRGRLFWGQTQRLKRETGITKRKKGVRLKFKAATGKCVTVVKSLKLLQGNVSLS